MANGGMFIHLLLLGLEIAAVITDLITQTCDADILLNGNVLARRSQFDAVRGEGGHPVAACIALLFIIVGLAV